MVGLSAQGVWVWGSGFWGLIWDLGFRVSEGAGMEYAGKIGRGIFVKS